MSFGFVCNSLLLGAGLAMDAFTVSLANGLNEPEMRRCKQAGIAGMFAGFQTLMPLIGWICVHTILQYFRAFEKLIPWIALLLLCLIGGKMLIEGIRKKQPEPDQKTAVLGFGALILQGIATSIDALSVGFTNADYRGALALAAAVMIGAVTFLICIAGLLIGRRAGMKLAGKATILGGVLLIGIGIEIFISHL